MRRILLLLVVVLGLAPGTYLRTDVPSPRIYRGSPIDITALPIEKTDFGPFTLVGGWQLDSPDPRFGGFGALVATPEGDLISASDMARLLAIRVEGGTPVAARIRPVPRFPADIGVQAKEFRDLEAMTRDPVSGKIWMAYEATNFIARHGEDFYPERRARPQAMRDWSPNGGAEALARLTDGRFVAIEEASGIFSSGRHRALMFEGDPASRKAAIPFTFSGMEGYRPVDMTQTPDGDLMVLMRRLHLSLPVSFSGALMRLDPDAIGEGKVAEARLVTRIEGSVPLDNFEGMTFMSDRDGQPDLWLISDDNFMNSQRTLLLKFQYRAQQKARR